MFILLDMGVTVAMLTLHVDDGMLFGERSNRVYQEALAGINAKFNIKEWHDLQQGSANYLGMLWRQDDDRLVLDMGEYIDSPEEIGVKPAAGDLTPLDDGQIHMCKSVLAKVRWPISHVVPELTYADICCQFTCPNQERYRFAWITCGN